MTSFAGDTVAVIVCRDGRLPAGADEVVAEARGRAILVGSGAAQAAAVSGTTELWAANTPTGPGCLARALAAVLGDFRAVLMPGSADGRDLAPRLAAEMARPLLAGAVSVKVSEQGVVEAELLRVDGKVVVPASCAEPVVATLMPGARSPGSAEAPVNASVLALPAAGDGPDAEELALVEPDPATMDLADATRVLGGGAGLVPAGLADEDAVLVFGLLVEVARALGASAGATRVVTDAGWMPYDRQIGTTGVAVDPRVYVALGVSGASQHIGGLGAPEHIASVNVDASSPMTAMAELGIVGDALGVLLEMAERFGVEIPPALSKVLAGRESNLA